MKFSGRVSVDRQPSWKPWYGGEMPVPAGTRVNIADRYSDAMEVEARAECEAQVRLADDLDWRSANAYHSITAYRVVSA